MAESCVADAVSVRLIRSFEHRNIRHVVVRSVDLTQTVQDFMKRVREEVAKSSALPPPFKTFSFDCMKIEHQAHGAKTSDPVINIEDDDRLMLRPDATLVQSNVKHETEVSFFRRQDYDAYQANPHIAW